MMDLDNIPDTQTEAEELEEVVMGLIINSGQARSLAYAALKQAKQGDFAAAKAMMDQSRMALNEAHLVQTKLIEGDAGEGKMKVSLVLVHAQDHLSLRLKNGLIMKKINAIILLSSLTSASVFAGAYVENREAYNLASDQGEVMLRVGYNFDMGAGIMLTNTYTFQREDELKHGYNEIEGWYPLFKPTEIGRAHV